MFGLSLSKILLIVLIAAALWYGYRWLKRSQEKQKAAEAARRDAVRGTDLAACPACGTYAAAGLAKCPSGRADCPMLAA
ncbi:MAG: hypothetical protein RL477_1348 [Pseudomonadota bacterium]|jgi:membrane protein implicated in regulation of membrane protease activity